MISILIVEDEEYARTSLVKRIKDYHINKSVEILEAADGKEGFELYCDKKPDLVITDIKMPNIDGLELLKMIKEKNKDSFVIILSAYSEFEYARTALKYEAMDYLLKPIDDDKLKVCLDKFYNITKEEKKEELVTGTDMVTRYIYKSIRKDKENDLIGKSMFQKIFSRFRILSLYLPRNNSFSLEDKMEKMSEIFGSEMWTGFRFVELDNKSFVLVINEEKDKYFIASRIIKAFSDSGYEIYIGESSGYEDPLDIRKAYKESYKLLKYKIFSKEQILNKKILNKKEIKEYYLSNEKEDFLKKALEAQSESKSNYIINEIFKEITDFGIITIECLELLYSQIAVILRKNLKEYLKTEDDVELSSITIIDFSNLEQLKTYFLNISINICKLPMDTEAPKDIVEVMMEYAKQNYSNNITINEIADDVLFMNPTYISHVFSKKQGISFSTWLKNLRMEKAKELINNSNLSITEIAFMTGYNDTSQFIRVFKKENGMTPNKYKNLKN